MINETVFHKKFGKGVIVQVRDGANSHEKYIKVHFESEEKEFVFPSIFQGWLSTDSESLQKQIECALSSIESEKAKEKRLREIVIKKKELEQAKIDLAYLEKKSSPMMPSQNRYEVGTRLIRGKYYGTSAESIYVNCCDKLKWSYYEKGKFAKQKKLYSNVATPEGYSVWFLAHSNWTGTHTAGVINKISESYMEQWWMDSTHPRATKRKRIIFAKSELKYMFLGIYEFVGYERKEEINGKIYYVERFDLLNEQYPE